MRVAIVDRYVTDTWYSYALSKALSKSCKTFYYSDKNVWSSNLFPFQILRQSIKDRIDVVHLQFELNMFGSTYTNLFVPILLSLVRLARKKIVVTIHGTIPKHLFDSGKIKAIIPKGVPSRPKLLKAVMFVMYGSLSKLCSKIIVHSKIFKRWMMQYQLNPKKILVIPHGNSTDRNVKDIAKWKDFGSRIILNFGVISPRKGLETLILAFGKLKEENVALFIVGREMPYYLGYSDKIKRLGKDCGGVIVFTGFVSDEEMHYLFEKAEIVVLPYNICISASGALAIAIQHSKPLIVTRTDFFKEELSTNEAIFVSIDDPKELTKAMERLLKDEGLRQHLAKTLRKKAEKNCWDKVAEQTVEVYR